MSSTLSVAPGEWPWCPVAVDTAPRTRRRKKRLPQPFLLDVRTGRPAWKCRIRRDELPKHVRAVKGGSYQSRPWIGPESDANVNLGLFRPEDYGNDRDAAISAAARAAREFLKLMAGPPQRDVWDVLQTLKGMRRFGIALIPEHILPPGISRSKVGPGYVGRMRRGVVVIEVGPFSDPGEAWAALRAARAGQPPQVLEAVADPNDQPIDALTTR